MSGRRVAIRYARALYEVAQQENTVATVTKDLATIQEIMTQARPIRDYCLRLHVDRRRELAFIEVAFIPYVSHQTGKLLRVAVKNARLAALPYLSAAFKEIIDAKSGIVEVVLEGTTKPHKDLQEMVEAKIATRLQQNIRLQTAVVPALLGGFRILWNNRMIDRSTRGRLKKIRRLMKAN